MNRHGRIGEPIYSLLPTETEEVVAIENERD